MADNNIGVQESSTPTQYVHNVVVGSDGGIDIVEQAVQITALPALAAGSNAIGSVTVTALPSLPAGANAIGSVTVSNFPATQPVSGTFWQATQPVSAASLPLPSGASTAVKQPALGTAGSASVDVLTVQGIASMTALKVDGSAVTQPVSGTFFQATQPISAASLPLPSGAATAANQTTVQGTAGSPTTAVLTVQGVGSGTPIPVSGTFWQATQPVSGTLTANIGTTNGLALDATVTALHLAQASTTSGQTGALIQGAATTAAPTYLTGKTYPISLTLAGAVRTDGSGTTQPTGPANTEQTGLSAGSLNADLVAAVDVSGFRTACLQINGTYSGTLTFQGSNDNSTFTSVNAFNAATNQGASTLTVSSTNVLYVIPINGFRFLRVRMTSYSSGTATGVLELSTMVMAPVTMAVTQSGAVSQSGTWTVQQGSTPSSTPWAVNPVAAATGGYSYSHLAANATTTVKSGAGYLRSIVINTPGATDTITVYDNTAGSGTVIAVINDASSSATALVYDLAFATGLTLVIAGTTAPDITVLYK